MPQDCLHEEVFLFSPVHEQLRKSYPYEIPSRYGSWKFPFYGIRWLSGFGYNHPEVFCLLQFVQPNDYMIRYAFVFQQSLAI